jgi:uncharacterized protein
VALREEGVYSPLADVGLTKEDVRRLARVLNIPVASKPSMACLASRIPYGEEITAERLRRIAEAESFIKDVADVKQLRVRDHGNLARVEVGATDRGIFLNEDVTDRVTDKLRSLGFTYVTLDLKGYRSGSMDEVLSKKSSVSGKCGGKNR